jgi:hypothetical protein
MIKTPTEPFTDTLGNLDSSCLFGGAPSNLSLS